MLSWVSSFASICRYRVVVWLIIWFHKRQSSGITSRVVMEQSPLTQQSRPETFEPKVAQLYRQLFRVRGCKKDRNRSCCWWIRQDHDDEEKPEGFWREFFLLKPDNARFGQLLDDLEAIDLLHVSVFVVFFTCPRISFLTQPASLRTIRLSCHYVCWIWIIAIWWECSRCMSGHHSHTYSIHWQFRTWQYFSPKCSRRNIQILAQTLSKC